MADEPPKQVGRPFQKGQSGNPGGRTKAHRELARFIRSETNDARTLAATHLAISRGLPLLRLKGSDGSHFVQWGGIPPEGVTVVDTVWPDLDDIQDSTSWCADRGVGKTVQPLDLVITDEPKPEAEIDWDAVPLADRIRLLNAMKEIDALARVESTDGDRDDT